MPSDPVPQPATGAEAAAGRFAARVAQVAAERADAWSAFADALAPPDEHIAARLRSGEFTAAWRAGVSWVGADTEMFTGALMSLDTYARGAHRRDLNTDAAALAADHVTLIAPHLAELVPLREVARLCGEEATAWADGDLTRGRELRARQHALVVAELVPILPELGTALDARARADVWRVVGRLLLAFVSIETGQDYQRALLGEARARYLRPTT